MLPGPPVLCIGNKVTNAPIGILQKEILDMPDFTVVGVDSRR
jgi:hypothetical protein